MRRFDFHNFTRFKCGFRAKMGVNVEDVDMFSYFFKTNHSTLTIFGPEFIDYSVVICEKLKLDYDILEEPLGNPVADLSSS